tara:strand:+ start:782 stop:2569 length:1788 start_codon:yes stop_codon:yes gene_type:complete
MATTIKSTDLDFDAIKNSLKTHLIRSGEFNDYNFEGSALSSLLDVLAYNTHQNSLVANYALNESFLSTAQMRSSLVGLAGGLGYTVNSRTAAYAVVNLWIEDTENPSSVTMPAGFKFTTTVDNLTYTFQTRDTLTATNNGSNLYYFTANSNINVPIYEGTPKSKNFIAGETASTDSFVIPVTNIDIATIKVTVFEDPSHLVGTVYTNISDATTIDVNSAIFVAKETPNGFYEVSFGNGVRFTNTTPKAGNRILVEYTTVAGPSANGARVFTAESTVGGKTLNITSGTAGGGNEKESIESIRKNAPYLYASQNRMVTAEDYAALTLRNFKSVISDIKAWGGQDNVPPSYGSVYLSVDFTTEDATVIASTKESIKKLAKDLSVASFELQFTDPVNTFLEVTTFFQFNPRLTSVGQSAVEALVQSATSDYFDENLGKFNQSFRRSNLLSDIDAVDGSVLSSRASIKMQSRFDPADGAIDYVIDYPAPIAQPDDVEYTIQSENFFLNGKTCFLRNRISTSTIEAINVADGLVESDVIGSYDAPNGVLTLNAFAGSLISGEFMKIVATPANESVINPTRNNILKFDNEASIARAVLTDTL